MATRFKALIVAIGFGVLFSSSGQAGYPIAGVHPDRRPEGAPVIDAVKKDEAWYAHSLRGVTKPYPNSLKFLEDQGNWFTPFTRPGMPGPYDIRGLHGK